MKKIFVAEKDKSIVEMLRKILNMDNFIIIEASNGWDGLKIADEQSPDIFIANIKLPNLANYGFSTDQKISDNK